MFKAENGFTNLFSAFQYLIDFRKATISYSQAAGEKCILPLQPEAQKNQGIRAALASTYSATTLYPIPPWIQGSLLK